MTPEDLQKASSEDLGKPAHKYCQIKSDHDKLNLKEVIIYAIFYKTRA
jgi:hypothetical protein